MNRTRIVIIGAGGLGRKTLEIIEDCNAIDPKFAVVGFVDSNAELIGTQVDGYEFLGGLERLADFDDCGIVVAIGNPRSRAAIVRQLQSRGHVDFPSIIHPTAIISPRAQLGPGAIISPYCIVQTNARIGEFSAFSSFTVISHDCSVGEFVTTGVHICLVGSGRVGNGCNLGSGSVILTGGEVGDGAVIGANATVVHPIPPGTTAVGTPARVIER